VEPALSGLRIIEYGQLVAAPYAAKLLADLGAEVIKVEPLTGDPARRRGPFPGGDPHPERSGLFLYLNANKSGITLDTAAAEGRRLLGELAAHADVLVHNLPPAEIAAHGLDYKALAARNPRLVMTSITPFGLSGPHARFQATDAVIWNAGGIAALNGGGPGSDDLPPLKAFGSQAEFQGGVTGAVATLGAVFERLRSGVGQHVDVSMQETLVAMLELTFEYWPYQGLVASRLGAKPIQPLDFFECRDGWIFVCCVEEHQWKAFVDLMGRPEWAQLELFESRLSRAANWDALKLLLAEWVKEQCVEDLYRAAQQRRIPFAPVSTMGDLLSSPHLAARGFFASIDHPEAGPLPYPGAPYRFSHTPWTLRQPAPCLGQDNEAVYGGLLGLSSQAQRALAAAGVI
jgi:crotonobetainyl-CoA:carnitine CoA-transferase CaiB-like acyl-CoA transferase